MFTIYIWYVFTIYISGKLAFFFSVICRVPKYMWHILHFYTFVREHMSKLFHFRITSDVASILLFLYFWFSNHSRHQVGNITLFIGACYARYVSRTWRQGGLTFVRFLRIPWKSCLMALHWLSVRLVPGGSLTTDCWMDGGPPLIKERGQTVWFPKCIIASPPKRKYLM